MKRTKISLALGSAVLAITALGFAKTNAQNYDASYYWFNSSLGYNDYSTIASEKGTTGCDVSGNPCAYGYTLGQINLHGTNNPTIKVTTPPQTPKVTLKQL